MCLTLHWPCRCVVIKPYLIFQTCFTYTPPPPPKYPLSSPTPAPPSSIYVLTFVSLSLGLLLMDSLDSPHGLSLSLQLFWPDLSCQNMRKPWLKTKKWVLTLTPSLQKAVHKYVRTGRETVYGNLPLFIWANCVTITPHANDRQH